MNDLLANIENDDIRLRNAKGEDLRTSSTEYLLTYIETKIDERYQTFQTESNNLSERFKQMGKRFKQMGERFKQIEKEMEKSRTQYIAILGIFASIIIAFVASFTFSTSVLENMHQVSFHRLSFVIVCIALFVVNILQGLFDYLGKIHDEKYKKIGGFLTGFNCLMFAFVLLIVLHYCASQYLVANSLPDWLSHLAFLFPRHY